MRDGVAEIFDCSARRGVEIVRAGAGRCARGCCPVPPIRATAGRESLPSSTCCVEQASGLPRASHRRRKGCLTRPILRATGSQCSSKSLDPREPHLQSCLVCALSVDFDATSQASDLSPRIPSGSSRIDKTTQDKRSDRRAKARLTFLLNPDPRPSTITREP